MDRVLDWLNAVRGPSVLVKNVNTRLAMEIPKSGKADLLIRGWEQLRGEIPPLYLKLVSDDDGEPLGFKRAEGLDLVGDAGQVEAFSRLPSTFRFKEAKKILGREDQSTTNFLNKLISLGLLKRGERKGEYLKTTGVNGVKL